MVLGPDEPGLVIGPLVVHVPVPRHERGDIMIRQQSVGAQKPCVREDEAVVMREHEQMCGIFHGGQFRVGKVVGIWLEPAFHEVRLRGLRGYEPIGVPSAFHRPRVHQRPADPIVEVIGKVIIFVAVVVAGQVVVIGWLETGVEDGVAVVVPVFLCLTGGAVAIGQVAGGHDKIRLNYVVHVLKAAIPVGVHPGAGAASAALMNVGELNEHDRARVVIVIVVVVVIIVVIVVV